MEDSIDLKTLEDLAAGGVDYLTGDFAKAEAALGASAQASRFHLEIVQGTTEPTEGDLLMLAEARRIVGKST